MMTRDDIERLVFDRICNGTSFVKIEEVFIENGFDFYGDLMLCTNNSAKLNIFFWGGWNKEAVDIFHSAFSKSDARYIRTSYLLYYMDGKVPNSPIAKQFRKYKDWHWMPVVIGKE